MKAKILTFVRGLMNGTPPRFQSYLKSLLLLVAVVASVSVWGETYTWTLASGDLGATGSPSASVTKGSPSTTWSTSYTWGNGANKFFSWDNSKGVQIGSGSNANKCSSLVLTTSGISGDITAIIINASHASSGGASIASIKVDGVSYYKDGGSTATSVNCSTSASEYTFKPKNNGTASSGEVVITISNSAAKAIYLKSIKIDYTVAEDPYTVTFDAGSGTCGTESLTEASAGAGVTLPSASPSSACGTEGWTFAGWKETSAQAETTSAPTLFAAGANYKPSANCTLYAVYKITEGGGSAIESVTWSSRYNATTDVEGKELAIGTNAKVTHNKGSNSNKCQYYTTGTGIRVYGGGNFVVTASGSDITAISLTFGSGDNSNEITANTGTYSNGSWSGKATSVTFSVGGTSNHRRIAGISVTYSGGTTTYNSKPSCATLYDVTVNASNGSIALYSDQQCSQVIPLTNNKASVEEGTTIWIKAIANNGYELSSWGGALSGTTNPTSLTINDHKTITATFVPATYQITYNLDGGAWNGEAGVATYTYGTGVLTLPTNVEKANNTFLGWYVTNPAEIVTFIGATETGDKSFIASWLPSGARDVTYSGGEQLNYISNPQIVGKEDPSLTVTYSVNKGYTISTVAVTVNDAALTESEVVFNDEQLIITPTAGFTGNVSITFTVVEKKFTVTWMANKTQFKQEQIQEGSKVTLPAETPEDVISGEDTYKFQGWTVDEQYSNETDAPAYITNNTIEPTGDVTYYAVYAMKESSVVENSYVKGTKADLTEGQKVIIVNGNSKKALSSENLSNTQTNYRKAISVTITNNKISNTNANIVWTVSLENSKYIFKQGTNYLNSTGSNLYCNSDKDTWTITAVSGNAGYTLLSTGGSKYLEYFSNYTEFTCYTGGSGDAFNMDFYIPETTETIKNYRTRVAIIDYIAVHEAPLSPERTNLVAGETFDATGLSIDVHYQGEDNPTNVTEGFTFAPMGALTTENNKITFTYQGKTADVAISVSNTVSGIAVTTNPSKMEYTEGQQFDPAGMVVTATYDNKAERVVTGYTYTPTGDLALGNKITISFGGQTTELKDIKINAATKTTVNWFVEGVKLTEGEQSTAVIPGKKVTVLPLEPEACQGNQFVGWTAVDANYYNATTAPTDLFKTFADAPVVGESETNYYAVFASEAVGTYDEKVTLTSLTAPTADKFTYAFAKSSGSTSPSWNADQAKTYVKNTLTVTSKNSRVITKIEYTYNINKNDKGNAPTGATVTGNNSDNGSWDATNKTWTSSTNAATTVTLTVNGSAGNYGFTAIKVYLTGGTVLSDYSTTCLAALANPTITTAEGEYCGFVDVEITQPAGNPEGAKIMYSTDNTNWNEYEAAVKLEASGTIYAKVVKAPKETDVVSATYTVYPAYTLAQAAAAASATSQIACLTFTDLLVQARSQSEAFLKASDGQIVLLNKSSHGLSVGDKLVANDAHVTFVKAHDLLQLTSTEGIAAATTGNATTPEEKAITALVAADYGQLVKIMNVTYDATNKKFTDASSNEIAVDAKFFVGGNLPSWPDGGKFNATGIVLTNGDKVVIAPRNTEDLESLATPLDKPTNFAVASVNSYRASYSWTTVDNNVGYTLYIYDGATEIYKSNKIGSTIETYAPQKDLEAGHTYTAKLVALGDKAEYSDSPAAEVEFTTNPNAKLNWYVGGSLYQTTYASQEKVVTPEDPESPCATNYENFVTWYTEEIVSETGQITALEAAKKVKAGDAAASQAGSAKEYNFYAVFGKIKTQGTDKYVAVTEAQDNWKGEYLIGYDEENDEATSIKVFDGSLTTLEAANDYKTISLEEDGSIAAATNEGYQFNIEKSTTEGYYTIQSASGKYIANTTNKNGLSENATTAYKNTISWDEGVDIMTGENTTASYLGFNTASDQLRFRYYTSNKNNIILYKREKTNPQYSGYITTCPQTYTITIAENTKGLVEAATTTEILKGAKVLLTATAYDGYTKTGGAWVVKNTNTKDVVEGLVGATNYLTMPDYDVTVDYNFQEIKDQFVDNLHGNTAIEKGGANYELPTLEDAEPGEKCDAYYVFAGWVAAEHTADSGEPAEDDSHVLNGKQTATGATYYALWWNVGDYFITECCTTPIPEKRDDLTKVQATSAQIGWYKVDGADKYHVTLVKDGDTKGEGEDLVITDGQYKYVMNGLTVNTSYTVYVKAHISCWGEEQVWNFTTAEEKNSYKVTINAEGGTYTIDPVLVDGKITEGETVTITDIIPNDADHYFFKELTVPEATDLTEVDGSYMFTMPGKAVTINIVFAEYPTVTWKMAGAADQTSIAVRKDDKFEVGTVKETPADWKYKTYFPEFAGWVTSDKCDADGNVTTAEFITATTEVPADGLTVYGAVAKSAKADMTGTLTKVIANDNIDANAYYIIGADKNGTDNTQYYFIELGNKWGVMNTVDNEDNQEPMLLKAIATTGGFSLKNLAGSYIDGCSSKTFTMSENASTLSLSTVDADKSAIQYYYSSGNKYWKLRHNYGTAQGIRWYDGTTGVPSYLYKVTLAYEKLTINPQSDYGRTDLVVGNYGTVCVPYIVTVADRSGATFWSIETSDAIGYTNPTSVTIVQEEGDLVAGKPYIFCATETEMAMFFSGDKYEGTESVSANGLYGNLTEETITINDSSDPDAGSEPTRGYFFVLQQKLYECGWNCTVGPNRGWVQAAEIVDKSSETQISVPRRVIGNPNGTPTGIHNLNADGFKNIEGARKYFHNNNIVIVNEGRIYNAQGILIQ